MRPAPVTITSLLGRFWRRSLLTWVLVLAEGVTLLAMPLVIGWAVDGLLNDQWGGVIQLASLSGILLVVGAARRFYDTRAYAGIYRTVAGELVRSERTLGHSISRTSARVNLFSEFVEFMEESLPDLLHQIIGLVGTLLIIAAIDLRVLLACVGAALLVAVIYGVSGRRIYRITRGGNDELERQVDVLADGREHGVSGHFRQLTLSQIRLSDLETVNYSLIWLAMTSVVIYTVIAVSTSGQATFGQILSAVMYVYGFSEAVMIFPMHYQHLIRLREIGQRLAGDHEPEGTNITASSTPEVGSW